MAMGSSLPARDARASTAGALYSPGERAAGHSSRPLRPITPAACSGRPLQPTTPAGYSSRPLQPTTPAGYSSRPRDWFGSSGGAVTLPCVRHSGRRQPGGGFRTVA
ncbi:hypothetical protein GCM10010306_074730 [Streptomyces umbrinus]|nr:hypothetical protein GCM10010306_074730 [Streptomyces umbrinus]